MYKYIFLGCGKIIIVMFIFFFIYLGIKGRLKFYLFFIVCFDFL